MTLLGAAIVVWSLFPVYWMVVSAIRPPAELFRAPTLLPGRFSLDSFGNLLRLTSFGAYYWNSTVIAVVTTIVTVVVSTLMAYALNRFRFRGVGMLTRTMLFAYMFPPLMLAIPLYTMFVRLKLDDTLVSLVVCHLTITLPLGVWLLWGFFKSVPYDIEEAALVDGASRLQTIYLIVVPVAMPGIVTVALFAFILSWTDLVYALILVSSDAKKTVPLGLAAMLGAFDIRWGEVMAGSALIAVPLLVVFIVASKAFVRGLTVGAVKE
jgi:ABC-type glycerol-3-phosphate transport system permease component